MTLTSMLVLSLAATAPHAADTACVVQNPQQMPAEGRQSPLDSLTVTVGSHPVKVCYGRPSLRGRRMLGSSSVPYGKLWRTGANEPTIFHTPVALKVAGVEVPAGTYSLYTVPDEKQWEIIVNRATSQWGHESRYTAEVEAQEVGRGKAPAESLAQPVETFTIRSEPGKAKGATLILEWEKSRVKIPVEAA